MGTLPRGSTSNNIVYIPGQITRPTICCIPYTAGATGPAASDSGAHVEAAAAQQGKIPLPFYRFDVRRCKDDKRRGQEDQIPSNRSWEEQG